jgi:sulfatase modifying factor 1
MLSRFLPALALLFAACASSPPVRDVPPVAVPVGSSALPATSAQPPVADSNARHAKMIEIHGGSYDVGEDSFDKKHPKRSVTLPAFAIDATEVTVADYAECFAAKACTLPRHDSPICNGASEAEGHRAVNCVDLRQARGFCGWVGKRLPSEEEWESAARAGSSETMRQTWPCGTSVAPLVCDVDDKRMRNDDTSPLGIIGMAGNVSEWTATPFEIGKGPVSTIITKGGSYRDAGTKATLSARVVRAPHAAYPNLGFRCVRAEGGDLLRGVALEEVTPAPDLSEAELVVRYVAVWKKVFAAQQHASAEDVDRLIKVKETSFSESADGTELVVAYDFTLDWATVPALGALNVRRAASQSLSTSKGPFDRWLDDTDAEASALELIARAPQSFPPLPVGKSLKFKTRAAAFAALPGGSGARFKGEGAIELARPQWPVKDIYMVSTGVIDEQKNVCLDVVLNLITGTAERSKNACRFY